MDKEQWITIFTHETKNFMIDFIAGSIAGVVVTLTGHPFDTIKVRMQKSTTMNDTGFFKTVKSCFMNEGVAGFFKGMSFPLYSVPLVNAVVFSFHEMSKKIFGFHDENEMNIYEGVVCGAFAGLANCIVVTPVELVKCRLQIQQENKANSYYKGVSDCIKKTYLNDGFKGLFKGNSATILREVPAYAAQFGGYYYAKQFVAELKGINVDQLGNMDFMLCGAIGGYSCWQFSYPQDVIKTVLQTNELEKRTFKPRFGDGGFYECAKHIHSMHGLMGFWRGFLPCSLRALIANGSLFVTYENSQSLLSNHFR